MFKAISSSNEIRIFVSYGEAREFALREGDKSRLWSIHKAK